MPPIIPQQQQQQQQPEQQQSFDFNRIDQSIPYQPQQSQLPDAPQQKPSIQKKLGSQCLKILAVVQMNRKININLIGIRITLIVTDNSSSIAYKLSLIHI
eukprot:TRINITY_DN1798_c0_g1_i13.p2 TRINITY_DN1798_c0_g1~~TRINITY_DN1798_c0_g1_i13.p2  ORF type:complete len:100 (-),score=9.47 TRINITY_DN1798_c0_g1_i13:137-436(-)